MTTRGSLVWNPAAVTSSSQQSLEWSPVWSAGTCYTHRRQALHGVVRLLVTLGSLPLMHSPLFISKRKSYNIQTSWCSDMFVQCWDTVVPVLRYACTVLWYVCGSAHDDCFAVRHLVQLTTQNCMTVYEFNLMCMNYKNSVGIYGSNTKVQCRWPQLQCSIEHRTIRSV